MNDGMVVREETIWTRKDRLGRVTGKYRFVRELINGEWIEHEENLLEDSKNDSNYGT